MQCIDAFLISVSRADFAVEFGAGIEVMVHAVDPRGFQAVRLFLGQQPQTGTDLQIVLGLDLGHDLFDLVHFALAGAASGNDDAVRLGVLFARDSRAVQQLFPFEDIVLGHACLRDFGLRAVRAVLGAQAAFGIDQEVQLDRLAKKSPPNAKCAGHDIQQFVI